MTKQFQKIQAYSPSILLALGFLLLVALLRLNIVSSLDRRAYEAIAEIPSEVKYPLYVAMQVGSILLPVVVAFFLALARQVKLAVIILAVSVSAWLLAHLIKGLLAHPRPTELVSGYGFPSTHAAVAAAFMYLVSKNAKPVWKLLACVVVSLVGLGRVYSGYHFPMDVAGGVILGVAIASLADTFLTTKLGSSRPGSNNI